MDRDDLTSKQNDYAVFLPALSGFYATYIGKQRSDPNFIPPERMPDQIPDMEQLNWLNPQKGLFPYKWSLYSAGHANLDLSKPDPGEDMVRNRDPGSIVVGDSGGFQIAKGVWEGIWSAPGSPEFLKLEAYCRKKTSSNMQKCANSQLFRVTCVVHRKTYNVRLLMTCYVSGIKHILSVYTVFLVLCRMYRHRSWQIANYLTLKL